MRTDVAKGKSRLQPQNQFWFEDLPRQCEPNLIGPDVYGHCNAVGEFWLEVSRTESQVRGPFFLWAIAGVLFAAWYFSTIKIENGVVVFLIDTAIAIVIAVMTFFAFRLELRTPRDRPVRFSRKKRKVYAYEYKWTWNPFGRWPATVKVFDWDNVQAEITLQRGFSGKVYVERYALSLAHCRPGTDEVIDRFDLRGNAVLTHGLRAMWSYCCQYMAQGPDDLPKSTPRPQDIRFLRCLFYFMPWFEPTGEGREYRRNMHWVTWLLALITLPVMPFLLLFGLSNYVVLRLAPEPKWPTEMDAESRSAKVAG